MSVDENALEASSTSENNSSQDANSLQERLYTEEEMQNRLKSVAANVRKEVSSRYEKKLNSGHKDESSGNFSNNSSDDLSKNSKVNNSEIIEQAVDRLRSEIAQNQKEKEMALVDSTAKEVFSSYVNNISKNQSNYPQDFKDSIGSLTEDEHRELAVLTHNKPNQSDLVYYYAKNPDALLQIRNAVASNNFAGAERVISNRASIIENSNKSKSKFSSKAPSPISKVNNSPAHVDVQPRSVAAARRHQKMMSQQSKG